MTLSLRAGEEEADGGGATERTQDIWTNSLSGTFCRRFMSTWSMLAKEKVCCWRAAAEVSGEAGASERISRFRCV
jgi:hypothetical protein